jgi:hypothetical protein
VLILHRSKDRSADVRASRYMAQRLANARLVELAGDDQAAEQASPASGDCGDCLTDMPYHLGGDQGGLSWPP